MLSELKSDLEAIYSKANNIELVNDILDKLSTINVTEMTKNRTLIADLFYATMVVIQETMESIPENKVFDAFYNISQIAQPGEESASLILLNFLNELFQHRSGLYTEIEISVDETIVLLKDLEPIKFIFLLCDENEERYFPANRLLSNIICDRKFISSRIEPYHINILQLAVEMFKFTGEEDSQKQFDHLIEECNLKFINYLDGTSVRVDTVDMANYKHNNVMVFFNEQEQKVLIRHENENYFKNLPNGIQINHEINLQKVVIGHYVELPVDGVAIDYSYAVKENPIELLELIYTRECKNVLIEKMILKTNEGKYIPLNPFCDKDKWVIKGHINKLEGRSVTKERFVECLDECRLQNLSSGAQCDGINQASFGLCVALLEKETVEIKKLISSDDELECRQSTIIRNWVNLSTEKIEAIEYSLRKWVDDIDYCDCEDSLQKFSFEKGRIRDVLPFAMNLKWVYELLEMPETPSIFVGTISYEEEDIFYIDFSPRVNKSMAKMNHGEINGVYSSEIILSSDTVKEDIFQDQMSGYFVLKDGKWYFNESLQNLLKIIVNVELMNEKLIKEQIITYFSESRCRPIFECMNLHIEELLDVDIKKLDPTSMYIYRLIHNLLLNKITDTNAKEYVDLIVKHQKLAFDGIEKDELFCREDSDTLIVPKDKLESDAVLRKVYNRYIRKHANRDDLWWYFPKGLTLKKGEYFRNNQRINTMRFLFDNIGHGTATLRTIAANIGKEKEWIDFEEMRTQKDASVLQRKIEKQKKSSQTYKMGNAVVRPIDIYSANKPKIVVHSYFGTDEGDRLLREFFKFCGLVDNEYDVSHQKEIVCMADRVEKECQKLGLDYENKSGIFIVIREFNMTKMTLLPKGSVGDANIVSVLFVKKEEKHNMGNRYS